LVDVLDDPANGGGIRHVAEVVDAYFRSGHRDDDQLVVYCEEFGNRTVFKRLGYIIEALSVDAPAVAQACIDRISRGISRLDPHGPTGGPILTRWNLRINAEIRA
jgi:predicted transcriptional regulator of viral defense system